MTRSHRRPPRNADAPWRPQPGVSVIGAGNWGTSLIHALAASRNARFPLDEIVTRRSRSRIAGMRVTPLERASLDAQVLWLCVPDAAIAQTAEEVAAHCHRLGRKMRGQIVVHSSGALTVDALRAVSEAGADVASVHPVMTFPTRRPVPLQGVLFGIEGEPRVRRRLSSLVRMLGGEPFPLDSNRKALYHAAGVMASPLIVSALSAAFTTAMLAGLEKRQALRLVAALSRASAANFFSRGPDRSFSGPLARGDAATIDLHLRALQQHPILREVYCALARYSLTAFPVRKAPELRHVLQAADENSERRRPPITKQRPLTAK